MEFYMELKRCFHTFWVGKEIWQESQKKDSKKETNKKIKTKIFPHLVYNWFFFFFLLFFFSWILFLSHLLRRKDYQKSITTHNMFRVWHKNTGQAVPVSLKARILRMRIWNKQMKMKGRTRRKFMAFSKLLHSLMPIFFACQRLLCWASRPEMEKKKDQARAQVVQGQ